MMGSARVPRRLVVAAALAVASCAEERGETWGFVATLGDDTTSIERITRVGDRIVSDAIGRAPRVMRRRWEATLAPDGSLRTWSMDTEIANVSGGGSQLHHALEWSDSTVRVVRQTAQDSTDRAFRQAYARSVPWNAFVYGTYELLVAAARQVPDTVPIGVYFFEGWAEGRFGSARVRPLEDGRLAISSSGLAGSGIATVDQKGRLLGYSGDGTTYKQEVRRVTEIPDLDAIFERFAEEERAAGVSTALSPRDTARATVGPARVIIDYSRPYARGRTLVGGLIPYDRVWRTGANAATHLTISAPLRLAGVALDSGTYTLWTLPTRDGVKLIVNGQTGQWGTGYGAGHDVARVPMQVDTLATPVEQFTIRVDSAEAHLVMEWGTFRWSAPIAP